MMLMKYDNIPDSAAIFSLLMYAFLGMAATIIYGTLLTANGNLKVLNITSAIAVVINISLNLVFIPKYQAFGAAIAAVFTQGFVGLSQFIFAARKFGFGLDTRLIFKLAVFIAGVVGLGLESLQLNAIWWVSLLSMMAASMVLAMALNLIELRSMIKLITNGDKVPEEAK